MKALITGISGQDGSYLAEYLMAKGYEVCGIIRRNSVPEHQESRIGHMEDRVTTHYGDLLDVESLYNLLEEELPDEIYNLAAQSHVRISSDIPIFTSQTNFIGVLNLLEAYRRIVPAAKFYQASSSEMFGSSVDEDNFQRETTPMHPVSPYGIAKLAAYHMVRHYRKAYNLHCCNGILFNHESPRRGSNFVTNKVVKAAVRIRLGLQEKLELGNIDSFRDWGHSKDYVRAMHLILNQKEPQDLVVSTGRSYSVRMMVNYVFERLEMENPFWFISINDKFMRPDELKFLRGDSSKIRALGWEPEYTFETMMDEMITHWLKVYKDKRTLPDYHQVRIL